MRQRWKGLWLNAIGLILLASPSVWAASVTYSANPLGGGLFQYSLTIINVGGPPEPIAGLNILNGNSIFGLTPASSITVPPGWDFFAPVPGLINELNFFSVTTATDVPIGGSLGGFSFQSARDPSTIGGNDFLVEPVFASSGQGSTFIAQPIPEPISLVLLSIGLVGVATKISRRGKTRNSGDG